MGFNPLHWAIVLYEKLDYPAEIFQLLIDLGVNPKEKFPELNEPTFIANLAKQTKKVSQELSIFISRAKIIETALRCSNEPPFLALFHVNKLDVDVMRMFLQYQNLFDINTPPKRAFKPQTLPINIAITTHQYELARALISSGAKLNNAKQIIMDGQSFSLGTLDYVNVLPASYKFDRRTIANNLCMDDEGNHIFGIADAAENPPAAEIPKDSLRLVENLLAAGADPRPMVLFQTREFENLTTGSYAYWLLQTAAELLFRSEYKGLGE